MSPTTESESRRSSLRGRRPLDPATVLSGASLLAAAGLVAAFFTVVRGEPRPDLALTSAAATAAVGAAVLLRVPLAPLGGVAIAVFLVAFPALRRSYAFSLERPDETLGLVFTVAALTVAGVAGVSGLVAVAARWSRSRALAGRTGVVASGAAGLGLAALLAVGYASQAQPDQSDGLTEAQVAALPVVVMDDYRYSPDRLDATAGVELGLRLVNDDTETYRFTVDELGVDVVVPSGRTAVVRVVPPEAGTLEFYSGEEGGEHRDLGMVGELVVGAP